MTRFKVTLFCAYRGIDTHKHRGRERKRARKTSPIGYSNSIVISQLIIDPNKCSFFQLYSQYQGYKTRTFEMVRAGLHCSFKISRQMLPLLFMFGWNTFVLNATCKSPPMSEREKSDPYNPMQLCNMRLRDNDSGTLVLSAKIFKLHKSTRLRTLDCG